MSNYLLAPQTGLLASQCLICGRPLCDARSVEIGIGPECREKIGAAFEAEIAVPQEKREAANKLVYRAALAAQEGNISLVQQIAAAISSIGLTNLGMIVAERFMDAEKKVKITIEQRTDGMLEIVTPFKRDKQFVADWRVIPGRKYNHGRLANVVPVEQKPAVFALLKKWFPGYYGKGCKGIFRLPPREDGQADAGESNE